MLYFPGTFFCLELTNYFFRLQQSFKTFCGRIDSTLEIIPWYFRGLWSIILIEKIVHFCIGSWFMVWLDWQIVVVGFQVDRCSFLAKRKHWLLWSLLIRHFWFIFSLLLLSLLSLYIQHVFLQISLFTLYWCHYLLWVTLDGTIIIMCFFIFIFNQLLNIIKAYVFILCNFNIWILVKHLHQLNSVVVLLLFYLELVVLLLDWFAIGWWWHVYKSFINSGGY